MVVVTATDELEAEVVVTAALVVVTALVDLPVLALELLELELVLLADDVGLDDEELELELELLPVLELLPLDVDLVVTWLIVVCDEEIEDVVPR